ncbi:hypothetical protein [Desulfurivibrio sp. C05AmB]|uniref:hypothetical protein n=1 Tax=Desulfurivibrio sp. C05AmB TaxID=3374371 RepID=UPI00376F2E7D
MRLEMTARQHWEKTKPKETAQMKKAGTFDQTMKEIAEQANLAAAEMVARGTPLQTALEIVRTEHILAQ